MFWLLADLGQLWLSVLSSQKYKPMKFCQAQTRTLQRKSFNIIRKMIQARLRTKLLKAANSTRDKKGRYSNHSQKYKTLERSNLQNFIPLSYQFRKYIHPELSLSLIRIWRKMTLLKISCSFSCPCDQLLTTMSPTMLPELPSLLIKQKSRNIEFRQIQWDSMPVVSLLLCNEEAGNISKKHWLDNLLFCESTNVAFAFEST